MHSLHPPGVDFTHFSFDYLMCLQVCFVFTIVKIQKEFTIKLSTKNDSCHGKAQGKARLWGTCHFRRGRRM